LGTKGERKNGGRVQRKLAVIYLFISKPIGLLRFLASTKL